MAFCTQCGKRLREGAKFCTQCGTKVRNTSRSPARPVAAQPSRIEPQMKEKTRPSTPIVFQTRQKNVVIESEQKSPKIDDEKKNSITFVEPPIITTEVKEEDQIKIENSKMEKISEEIANNDILDSPIKKQLKIQLQRIKYSFREIEEVEPYIFHTTFIAGSIKKLVWDFTEGFVLLASLPESVNPEIKFTLGLEENRDPYDWKNPYQSISFSSDIKNESILKKIKREGRVVEKLSRIKGAVRAEIDGKEVRIEIKSNIPENIRLGLDAVKELAWLLDITLK